MTFRLFAYGFRSQFFLAGLAAVVFVPMWALNFLAGAPLGTGWPPTLWHAHEMLFGFIASAIAGFMLTAVPSWTGQKGFAGRPLMALAALWVLARILIATSPAWPVILPALLDLAFLPTLAGLVLIPLWRSHNRNTPLLAVLAALWMADVAFYIGLWRHNDPLALKALVVGIDIVLLMVTVIGGRIVPAFTSSALRAEGLAPNPKSRAFLGLLSILAMVGVIAGDVVCQNTRVAGWIAVAAALIQGVRLARWKTWLTLRQPIVWILHVAYAWLPVGLALKAAALLGGYAIAAFWLHALTIGALTTMIVAVMTRASLGHTGRPLRVHYLTTLAYAVLIAAAVVRVFGLSLPGMTYPMVIAAAATLWTTAFLLFMGIYGPILWGPRADGKPG